MCALRSQVELLTATLQTIHPSNHWSTPEGESRYGSSVSAAHAMDLVPKRSATHFL